VPSSQVLLWPILLAPLAGAVFNACAGRPLQRRLGRGVVQAVALAAVLAAAAFAVAAVVRLLALPASERHLVDRLWTLLAVGPLHVDLALALDPLSAVMILVITLVGALIHVYAIGYMQADENAWRFFAYLNLFVFAMLLLVLADSLLLCFFGWEGVGLCSYLLIGYWYHHLPNAHAARKAFLVNRVGDAGLLIGVCLLFWSLAGAFAPERRAGAQPAGVVAAGLAPTLTFRELRERLGPEAGATVSEARAVLERSQLGGMPVLIWIGLALFLGMAGKSAQIPLYTWLPDAMAGPTPVSALIHAATMVTAGVYLGARLWFLFALSPAVMAVLAVVGVLTALLGAVLAMVQQDLKKVLAYSTISQLGFMFLALGVGAQGAAVFHLVTHACFKACLFLAAGSVIHAMHGVLDDAVPSESGHDPRLASDPTDAQDMRNMGGLARGLPRTRLAYALGALALAGFPIAAGFYSKDEILWRAFDQRLLPVQGWWLWVLALLTAGLTAYYVFRSYYLVFHARQPLGEGGRGRAPHESPGSMLVPLLVLGAASVVAGAALGWPEAWGGHPLLQAFLSPAIASASGPGVVSPGGALPLLLQALGVLASLAGWAVARLLYRDLGRSGARLVAWRQQVGHLHRLLWHRLWIDELYQELFVHPAQDFSRAAAWVDRHLVDGAVLAVARAARALSALGGLVDRHVIDGMVNGLSAVTLAGGRRLQRVQTGRINHYVLGIAVGAGLLVAVTWVLR
jgi:NADH-quinone oxidoreductase subunit L